MTNQTSRLDHVNSITLRDVLRPENRIQIVVMGVILMTVCLGKEERSRQTSTEIDLLHLVNTFRDINLSHQLVTLVAHRHLRRVNANLIVIAIAVMRVRLVHKVL